MDSSKLTDQQVAELYRAIGRQLRYISRLQHRMEQLRFPDTDRLYTFTVTTRLALRELDGEIRAIESSRAEKNRPGWVQSMPHRANGQRA